MTDFVQTMKDWRRMCGSIKGADCAKCPLYPYVCKTPWQDNQTPWDVVEKRISTWAADHPEPVYPSWGEWFVEHGDLVNGWQNATNAAWMANTALGVFMKPIPADIAQKLGIEHKEDV